MFSHAVLVGVVCPVTASTGREEGNQDGEVGARRRGDLTQHTSTKRITIESFGMSASEYEGRHAWGPP